MLQIVLHSSKTMTGKPGGNRPLDASLFAKEAEELVKLWRHEPIGRLKKLMQVSAIKAVEVQNLYTTWSSEPKAQIPAIDAFRGDIYSGLQAKSWSETDRAYAQEHLLILSGLYGALRACDGIRPYRLEMGYKLPDGKSMYNFWGNKLARAVAPEATQLVNLSAVEYTKALLPYAQQSVVTPKFMTVDPKTNQPVFVTVHAKIARGAFARWMILNRIDSTERLHEFNDLEYSYSVSLSTPERPVFICKIFKGIGLSVRK